MIVHTKLTGKHTTNIIGYVGQSFIKHSYGFYSYA